MVMKVNYRKIIRWIARTLALSILLFALPFYFGYGNPLSFVKASYSLWENVALTLMPLIFLGLALGWKYPKTAGWLIVISVVIIVGVGFFTGANLSANLAIPLVPGILYLIDKKKL